MHGLKQAKIMITSQFFFLSKFRKDPFKEYDYFLFTSKPLKITYFYVFHVNLKFYLTLSLPKYSATLFRQGGGGQL